MSVRRYRNKIINAIKYLRIDLYLFDTLNDNSTYLVKIFIEVYLINNLKTNILIKTNVFISYEFVINYAS